MSPSRSLCWIGSLFFTQQLKGTHGYRQVDSPDQSADSVVTKEPANMNHIASPDHSDSSIERQIQAKGLNAPRVTPAALQAVIVGCYFFTAQDGVTMHSDQAFVPDDHDTALGLLTICVLVLRNGFTVLGKSACASPENFDADIGRSVARKNAEEEIWPLLGYTLKEQLFQMTQPAQAPE